MALAFLLHGAGSLMLESAWVKAQVALFGSVPDAPGSVLVAYFLGVAAGSLLWRRGELARPRAFVPVAAALLLGAVLPFVPGVVLGTAGGRLPGWLLSRPALWLTAALSVLPACTAIGAFFPLIGRIDGGRRALVLYGMEAAGSLPGIVLGAWLIPSALGYRVTALAGAAAILAAWGLVAFRASALGDEAVFVAPPATAPPRLLALAIGSGVFSAMLQATLIRLVSLRSDNSVFSFVSVSFLLVALLACASFLAARIPGRLLRPPLFPEALLVAIVAGGLAAGLIWLRVTEGLSIRLVSQASGLAAALALSAPLVLVGGAFAALLLPLILRRARHEGEAAGAGAAGVATLVGANGVGCAAGAALGSFVLLPRLGAWTTLFAALCGYLALLGAAVPGRARIVVAVSGIALLAVANPLSYPLVTPADPFGGPPGRVVWVREGAHGTVAVIDYPGGIRSLWLNDTYLLEAFTGTPQATARLGALPVALHPRARDVALIGVGTGLTAAGALQSTVDRAVLLELIPEVAEAARTHFAAHNGGVLADPRVRLLVEDGRRHFARAGAAYDIVSTDLVTPWHEGSATLFTLEHFRAVRSRLRPGGIFCLWLPLYQLTREEFLVVCRTMAEAFPSVTIWQLGSGSDRAAAALVGAERLDAAEIAAAFAGRRIRPGEDEPLRVHPSGVFSRYVGPVDPADPLWRNVPLNTLDRPRIEFSAARPGRTLIGGAPFLDLVGHFFALSGNPGERYFAGYTPQIEDWRQAGRALNLYAWYLSVGDQARAAALEPQLGALPAYRPDEGPGVR